MASEATQLKERRLMEQTKRQRDEQEPLIEDLSVNDQTAEVKGGRTGASNTNNYFTDDYSLTTH
jgi:hypothetical protein